MNKYLILIFLLANTTLSYGAGGLFKGPNMPTNNLELYNQSSAFLTRLRPVVDKVKAAQEAFFRENENNGPDDGHYFEEMKDSIHLVTDNSQNGNVKHYKTKFLPTEADLQNEKWTSDLYINGIDFSTLEKNIATLAAHIDAAKPKPPVSLCCCSISLPWQQPKFSNSLATIKSDLKKLIPTNFETIKSGDATLTTTTDAQYGTPSQPTVCFIPPKAMGMSTENNAFHIRFSLVSDCGSAFTQGLSGLFSWDKLDYDGGITSEHKEPNGDTVITYQDATYPGTGAFTINQKSSLEYTLQCSYSFSDARAFEDPDSHTAQTHNRTLNLKGDPAAILMARSKLLEFMQESVIPIK